MCVCVDMQILYQYPGFFWFLTIAVPPFFCVCGSRHDDAVSKRGESSLFEDETERQLFDHHHHHCHHETTKGGFSRASFSFVVVVVVVVVRDYTRRRRSFSTLMMRRKKWFWFFVSQSLFATKKIERKKALKKKINNNIARNTKNTHTHNTPLLLPISLFGMHHSIPNNRRDDDR